MCRRMACVRSRCRTSSLTASTTDIGTPIDGSSFDNSSSRMARLGCRWRAHSDPAAQPSGGCVGLPDQINHRRGTLGEPWRSLPPGACSARRLILSMRASPTARGADPRQRPQRLYIYGGDVASTYDATEAEVITPALNCKAIKK